jgi:hypothetical protein
VLRGLLATTILSQLPEITQFISGQPLSPQCLHAGTNGVAVWSVFEADKDAIPPPQIPNIDYLRSTLRLPPISSVLLGETEIEFERTNLGEIQESANAGMIYHRGDAGGSEDWVCYTTANDGKPERIWFSSNELEGAGDEISSFYAITGNEKMRPSTSCPELPAKLRPVSLQNSLWLGVNTDRLRQLVGKPSAKIGDWRFYAYDGKVFIKGEDFDRLETLGVKVRNGRIVGLYEFQTTSN